MLTEKPKFTELGGKNEKNNSWLKLSREYFLKNVYIHKTAGPNKTDPWAFREVTNELLHSRNYIWKVMELYREPENWKTTRNVASFTE